MNLFGLAQILVNLKFFYLNANKTGEIRYIFVKLLYLLCRLGILGTKEYRKPEWVTQMEEMQEALRGKTCVHLNTLDCMPSDVECHFSSNSLDDCVLKNESSQRDSSTVTSEFSSTRILMNIGDDYLLMKKTSSKEYFSLKGYLDSMGTHQENITAIQYS